MTAKTNDRTNCLDDPVNLIGPYGLSAMAWARPLSIGIEIAGGGPEDLPADGISGAILGLAKLYDALPAKPQCAGRKKWNPNKPNRKKQGREPGEKKRQKPGWKPRNPPKEPPRHTPSRRH